VGGLRPRLPPIGRILTVPLDVLMVSFMFLDVLTRYGTSSTQETIRTLEMSGVVSGAIRSRR